MTLHDAVAIVTGASRGIGRAVALELASAGADVVCAARTTDAAASKLPGTIDTTARQIEALGRRALAVPCDVCGEAQVQALVEGTLAAFGRIDVLVNNAAVNYRAPFVDTPIARWDLVLGVNLRGTVLCTQAVLPRMVAQGSGRIINISSGAVTDAETSAKLGIIPYAVSKAAVEKLTETLAIELRSHQIAVNCLRIETAVATEGARLVDPGADDGSWAQPVDVAKAVLWLATRPPDYTGNIVTLADVRNAIEGGA